MTRYLGHVDELGENLGPELSGGPAQHHQLDPLGDAVAQGDGTLHHRDVLHAAVANVVLIVCKLAQRRGRVNRRPSPRGSVPTRRAPVQWAAHRYSAEGLELQEGEVLGQLDGLQVVEEEGDLPLFAGSDLLAVLQRPVPFVSGITRHR